jgi:hypothetical protein
MLSFFSSLRQQHRNTDGVHDPPLVADQIAHVDEIVRSVGPTSVDGLAVFTSLEASNALLLTMEAYVDDDGAGRRPLLGTSAPHDLQPLCHDAELWRNGGERKVSSLNVAIVSAEGGASSSFSAAGNWVALQGQVQQRHLVDPNAAMF